MVAEQFCVATAATADSTAAAAVTLCYPLLMHTIIKKGANKESDKPAASSTHEMAALCLFSLRLVLEA